MPNPTTTPAPQTTTYRYAGKESLTQTINKSIPKQLLPSKRIGTIFGTIFVLVLIIAAFQFPFSKLMSGSTDITIKIGYPMTFLELALTETDTSPIKPLAFILDLLLYLILAYAIDIALNLILKNPFLQSEKQLKKKPSIFKDRKPSIAEKVTQKVAVKQQLK